METRKTTVDIRRPLLEAAKRRAVSEGVTLRVLIEQGLELVLARDEEARSSYELEDGSFGGEGLQPGIVEGDWSAIRSLIYEGRGS